MTMVYAFEIIAGLIVAWLCIRSLRIGRRQFETVYWRPTRSDVSFDSIGFTVRGLSPHSDNSIRLSWTEVHRIAAYKHDLWSDCIVCLFFARADGTGIEVDEEMAGWEPFRTALPKFFPDYSPMPERLGEIPDLPATTKCYLRTMD